MKVVECWNWTQNVYFDERNNFVEEDVPVIHLIFKIIDIIGLIDSQYLAIGLLGRNTNFWSKGRRGPGYSRFVCFDKLSNFAGGTFSSEL